MQGCPLFDADMLVFQLLYDVLGSLICQKFHLFLEWRIEFGIVVPHGWKVRYWFFSIESIHWVVPKLAEGVDSLKLVLGNFGDGVFLRFVEEFFRVDELVLEDIEVGFLFFVGKQIICLLFIRHKSCIILLAKYMIQIKLIL